MTPALRTAVIDAQPQDEHLFASKNVALHERLILTDEGDVLAPDGYDLDFTREIGRVLASKRAKRKYIRWLRRFLKFELRPGEPTYALLTESTEDAITRCKRFLESLGLQLEVNDNHLDAGYLVTHPTSIRYLRTAVTVLRQLYTRLTGGLRPNPANPMNVNGWHLMTAPERLIWAVAHQYDKKHSLKHAGGRFQVAGATSSPPAIEDPSACGPQMTEALIDSCVPVSILNIALVMEANGCRCSSPLNGNALGWAMADFSDEFWATKKRGGDDLCLLLIMPDQVMRDVVARMEAAPHPRRRGSSLMTHLRELKALGTDRAKAELATYALFPSSLGTAYTYSGFYYWFDDAIDGRVVIRTSNASRKPTSQWYRHAAISADVKALFARVTNKKERDEALPELLEDYGLSSDQTRQYAAFEYLRDARRRQRARVEQRRLRAAAERAGVPVPVHTQRLTLPGAQQAHDALPIRRKI
jgi:hypothetical protein